MADDFQLVAGPRKPWISANTLDNRYHPAGSIELLRHKNAFWPFAANRASSGAAGAASYGAQHTLLTGSSTCARRSIFYFTPLWPRSRRRDFAQDAESRSGRSRAAQMLVWEGQLSSGRSLKPFAPLHAIAFAAANC